MGEKKILFGSWTCFYMMFLDISIMFMIFIAIVVEVCSKGGRGLYAVTLREWTDDHRVGLCAWINATAPPLDTVKSHTLGALKQYPKPSILLQLIYQTARIRFSSPQLVLRPQSSFSIPILL
jgi:hypothetical protein